ncbi:hypothetical protein [Streptomyces europaeiscabiei]|nr:hypothetical protein [Streptomyces europaeiscabiei]MDX3876335.1 hypothetical protein [Streptomyces europaeiscabiei]
MPTESCAAVSAKPNYSHCTPGPPPASRPWAPTVVCVGMAVMASAP